MEMIPIKKADLISIRRAAMNYLARREHTHHELFCKLKQKKFSDTDIHQALEQLTKEGLLSHTRFIENYIHYRREKGYGPLRIQAELTTRGLDQVLIEEHLQMTDNSWLEAARQLWQKRFKGKTPQDFKSKAQQMRFLYYRGFTQEQIENLLAHP